MLRSPELDQILGKKKFLPLGTDLNDKTLLIVRASSYGDYFFVAPTIEALHYKFKNLKVVYIANGRNENKYISNNSFIHQVLEIFKINNEWWDEKFEMEDSTAREIEYYLHEPNTVLLSYEATDGDYTFGDYNIDAFTHYAEAAGLSKYVELKKCDHLFDFNSNVDLDSVYDVLIENSLVPYYYSVLHCFSSQPSRGWPEEKLNYFLTNYSKHVPIPIVIIGKEGEGKPIPELKNVFDFRGKFSFMESIHIIQLALFGVFSESAPMHIGQSLYTPSIITHLHPWTKHFTHPYHDQTVQIVGEGSHENLNVDKVLEETIKMERKLS